MADKHSKWRDFRKSEADVSVGPVITQAQARRLYRNTEGGSPVDTPAELEMQKNNLGPKDSPTELGNQTTKSSKNPKSAAPDAPDKQDNEPPTSLPRP